MSTNILEKLKDIPYHDVKNIDLNSLNLKTKNENMIHDIYQQPGYEHYRLLCWISSQLENTTIYELGTWIGAGTICLAYNKTNRVISYDIEYNVDLQRLPNMEFRIGDYKNDKELLNAPFIFIDVMHDGKLEREIYSYLIEKNYKGVTVWDDIHLNPQMQSFWRDVTHEKFDITKYGHYSGTGVINFGDKI